MELKHQAKKGEETINMVPAKNWRPQVNKKIVDKLENELQIP